MAEDEEGEGRATDFLLMTIAGYILSSMQAHSPLKVRSSYGAWLATWLTCGEQTHFHARAHAYNRSDTTDGAKLVYLGYMNIRVELPQSKQNTDIFKRICGCDSGHFSNI